MGEQGVASRAFYGNGCKRQEFKKQVALALPKSVHPSFHTSRMHEGHRRAQFKVQLNTKLGSLQKSLPQPWLRPEPHFSSHFPPPPTGIRHTGPAFSPGDTAPYRADVGLALGNLQSSRGDGGWPGCTVKQAIRILRSAKGQSGARRGGNQKPIPGGFHEAQELE